jgi:deoxyribodipyrimidine photolyase
MIDISPKSPRLANRAILPSTQHSFRWNSELEFDSSPPTLSPHLLFLSVSALAYRDEEAARDASDGAGRREESSRPATSDKAKARGKRGYTDIRAYTDTFIPASIAALASVDSFLVLTCATRASPYLAIGPLPAYRQRMQEREREAESAHFTISTTRYQLQTREYSAARKISRRGPDARNVVAGSPEAPDQTRRKTGTPLRGGRGRGRMGIPILDKR